MAETTDEASQPLKVAAALYEILRKDLRERLYRIDDYINGDHDDPYMPASADAEYKLLAKRAVTNHCPLLIQTPSQNLYVDGFRRGSRSAGQAGERRDLAEWEHWENSRLSSRQNAVIAGALGYGHSFTVTERDEQGRVLTRGLSPLRTSAVYEDPANDDNPVAALHVRFKPTPRGADGTGGKPGRAILWDRTWRYNLTYTPERGWRRDGEPIRHGGEGENPVTRFATAVDLNGRTVGVIEPYIQVQNRINQTVFDLLVAQTAGSFKTRWATGMAPPTQVEPIYATNEDGTYKRDPSGQKIIEDWQTKIDPATGNPMPAPIDLNAKRFLFGEDDEVRFGTLDETPLEPYIQAVDLASKHLSSMAQIPPHYLVGQVANLSAEALKAAEQALARKVGELKVVFGESWERVFRLALRLSGDPEWEDMTGQVLWRDLSAQSLAQSADALGKLSELLGVPQRALWPRVPDITQGELEEWESIYEEESTELGQVRRSTPTLRERSQADGGQPERDPAVL